MYTPTNKSSRELGEHSLLDPFLERGRGILECRYPIIAGAMTWISDHKLVAAIGEAGGFGQLAGGNAPAEVVRDEILATRAATTSPFGVNLITIAPNFRSQLDLVCEMECKWITFAGATPSRRDITRAKKSGARVFCFAPTESLALKLVDLGVDGLVLEGSEAGGHIGPVALSVLLQQILFVVESVPIFVAGGIATGKMMAHLLMMGAAGIQMGTRFVMSDECCAHPAFKKSFKKARARDAFATPQFDSRLPVVPVRALKNSGTLEFGKLQYELLHKLDNAMIDRETAQMEVERFWVGALRSAVVDGDVKTGSLMAGQSVGLVNEIKPIAEIIQEFVRDAEETLQAIYAQLNSKG
jgi:enoyl-[acyl-carrier protein] reductase II